MSKLPKIVLGVVAALAAAPALADSPQIAGSPTPAAEQTGAPQRVSRVGTRLPVIEILGATDRDKTRWTGSGKGTPVLPTVSEDAFLEGEDADSGSASQR